MRGVLARELVGLRGVEARLGAAGGGAPAARASSIVATLVIDVGAELERGRLRRRRLVEAVRDRRELVAEHALAREQQPLALLVLNALSCRLFCVRASMKLVARSGSAAVGTALDARARRR